jgi:formylglycine-generating enzyme required for sulfatase activity
MGQTEVAVGAYKRYASASGVQMPTEPVRRPASPSEQPRYLNKEWGDLKQPMTMVTWDEARAYCERWARGRLPSEPEWEYAARAGTQGPRYGDLYAIAWVRENSGNQIPHVKMKQPNAWGLYDMLGSVWEWTADKYGFFDVSGQQRFWVRGGSWVLSDTRASAKISSQSSARGGDRGFRCVRDRID